ncbi:DUF6932 family protein [Mucilaginibacter lutimaris]|uniref:DUF6932 family protein n=1 Tax=Mucilaginibacter lutimaris TaxID=931629 RepID=A0ABW2ZIW4_9SPHI
MKYNGIYLAPGIYILNEGRFKEEFVHNHPREVLFENLKRLMTVMECVHSSAFYIGGSFVTKLPVPKDVDACWIIPVDISDEELFLRFPIALYPSKVKEEYGVHLFPVSAESLAMNHNTYIDMFQINRLNEPVGIIKIEY